MPDVFFDQKDFLLPAPNKSKKKQTAEEPPSSNMNFVAIVDWFLMRHVGKLRSFQLYFDVKSRDDCSHVHSWIGNLTSVRKVEELHLYLSAGVRVPHELQFCLFDCRSVVSLELRVCCFQSSPCSVRLFPSLKTLVLGYMFLTGEMIQGMLRDCPLLESLAIEYCYDLMDVLISAPRLLNLSLAFCECITLLEIDAPCLHSFKFHCCTIISEKSCRTLVADLSHVKVLEVCGCFLQALGWWKSSVELHPFSNLEQLTVLECQAEEILADIPVLLLRRSPNLQRLVIENQNFCDLFLGNEYRALQASGFQLQHLRYLELSLLNVVECELTLLEYFLSTSPFLEVTVILGSGMKHRWTAINNKLLLLQKQYHLHTIKVRFNIGRKVRNHRNFEEDDYEEE